MDDVFKVFENHYLFRATRPKWFNTSDEQFATFKEMANTGVAYILPKRALDGSLIFVINLERYDIEKYGTDNAFSYVYNALNAYMYSDENQILGFTLIMNYVNCSLKTLLGFPIRDSAEFSASANKCGGRYKKYFLVGLPSGAVAMINTIKKVMTEKQRDRLVMVKDYEELSQQIDKSLLTEFLGGTESESKVIENFIKNVEENFEKVRKCNEFELDMKKAAACRDLDESIGSFRTLEID